MQFKLLLAIASLAFVAAVPTLPYINSPADGIGNGNAAAAAIGAITADVQNVSADGNGIGNDNQAQVDNNNIQLLDVAE